MALGKEKIEELYKRMERLNIKDEQLIEKFILSSGKGGQKVNKTSSCVYLKHLPSQIEVKCQKGRSRALNRYYARKLLCEKIESQILKIKTEKKSQEEKIRRQKKRRSRRSKEKMLEEKKKRSTIKTLRKPPSE